MGCSGTSVTRAGRSSHANLSIRSASEISIVSFEATICWSADTSRSWMCRRSSRRWAMIQSAPPISARTAAAARVGSPPPRARRRGAAGRGGAAATRRGGPVDGFSRIKRLPPYVFSIVTAMKTEARRRGEDILDFGMGNPDMPTPKHIQDKLIEAVKNPKNHRYSLSKGIPKLREAMAAWYGRHYGVTLDPETEVIATIGSKEGLSHLALAIVEPGDVVLPPRPTYPIHPYSVIIAGGQGKSIPLRADSDFFEDMTAAYKQTWPRPKMLIIKFPHNPTTRVVDLGVFKQIA